MSINYLLQYQVDTCLVLNHIEDVFYKLEIINNNEINILLCMSFRILFLGKFLEKRFLDRRYL